MTERDWEQLPALLVDDVTYHNPAQFEPYRGKDALAGILRLVFSIFADSDYHRTFGREDGYTDGADNHDSGPTHLDSASGDTVSAYPNGEVAAAFTTRARPRPSAATVSRAAEPMRGTVLRIFVTGGPRLRGDGGMPQRIGQTISDSNWVNYPITTPEQDTRP